MNGKTLIIGGGGQVGMELTEQIAHDYGSQNVILTDIRELSSVPEGVSFTKLDVLNKANLRTLVQEHQIKNIFHLAAVLSATGEKKPMFGWDLNVNGLLNVLEVSRDEKVEKVFWPSSIAVFGPDTPSDNTPQDTIMKPNTVYGISKVSGELWCNYYWEKYGLDVRSIRYPGLIGYKSLPGGGTTDYAVEIFHEAIKSGSYTAFLKANTYLPMLYMPDALSATMKIMAAPKESIKNRFSYNLGGLSFSPEEITRSIKKIIPEFKCGYAPDFRQAIADSWPNSIDDSAASRDWGWKMNYNLDDMSIDMISNLRKILSKELI